MAFDYCRTIRFHETDAAGVVYFANALTLCHEAYEASLVAEGFDMPLFFSAGGEFAVPIVHAEVDFYRPMRCGDRIKINLTPNQLNDVSFEISYAIYPQPKANDADPPTDELTHQKKAKPIARSLTRHVCIHPKTRQRHPLPAELIRWIQAMSETTHHPTGSLTTPSVPND